LIRAYQGSFYHDHGFHAGRQLGIQWNQAYAHQAAAGGQALKLPRAGASSNFYTTPENLIDYLAQFRVSYARIHGLSSSGTLGVLFLPSDGQRITARMSAQMTTDSRPYALFPFGPQRAD
jgi:hypothetical protein